MTEIETAGVPEEDEKAGGITTLHHHLRKLILEGVYPPGARLSERELAQTLGVSRTPLREVLRMLGREGLVETGRYQRARVAPLDPAALDMLLCRADPAGNAGPGLDDPACRRRTLLNSMRPSPPCARATTMEEWEVPHRRFHQLLVSQAGVATT